MKLTVRLEKDVDGGYVAQCVEIPGAISQGETKEEAVDNVLDAIRTVIEVRRQQAKAHHAVLQTVEVNA